MHLSMKYAFSCTIDVCCLMFVFFHRFDNLEFSYSMTVQEMLDILMDEVNLDDKQCKLFMLQDNLRPYTDQ